MTPALKTILLADDHPIFRAGLRQVIEANGAHKVIAEVSDGAAAVAQIELLRPDFAVFDLSMPHLDGFAALQRIKENNALTKVLIVSMHADPAYAQRAKELGAIGLIAKEDAASEIIRALEGRATEFFMSQSVGGTAPVAPPLTSSNERVEADLSKITSTEKRVLLLLSNGMTSKQIAAELSISHRTVQAHRRNIADKLGVSGPNQLLQFAVSIREPLARLKPER